MALGKRRRAEEIARAALVGLAVGVQAYLVVDRLTDGQLSRSISIWATYRRHELMQAFRIEREVKESANAVIFEAMTIVEGA